MPDGTDFVAEEMRFGSGWNYTSTTYRITVELDKLYQQTFWILQPVYANVHGLTYLCKAAQGYACLMSLVHHTSLLYVMVTEIILYKLR